LASKEVKKDSCMTTLYPLYIVYLDASCVLSAGGAFFSWRRKCGGARYLSRTPLALLHLSLTNLLILPLQTSSASLSSGVHAQNRPILKSHPGCTKHHARHIHSVMLHTTATDARAVSCATTAGCLGRYRASVCLMSTAALDPMHRDSVIWFLTMPLGTANGMSFRGRTR
jgi:hypothetical protein